MNKTHFSLLLTLDILVILLAGGVIASRLYFLHSKTLAAAPQSNAAAAPAPQPEPAAAAVNDAVPGNETGYEISVSTPAPAPRNIAFVYLHSRARQVQIIGDFNHWLPEPMTKGLGNKWSIAMPLAPGEYAYNFIVDGRPVLDPANARICDAGRGFPNSYIKVIPRTDENS